jgi:hypothetical protein
VGEHGRSGCGRQGRDGRGACRGVAGTGARLWGAGRGCGAHTMHATKAAFRLSLTREKWPRKSEQADKWRICYL